MKTYTRGICERCWNIIKDSYSLKLYLEINYPSCVSWVGKSYEELKKEWSNLDDAMCKCGNKATRGIFREEFLNDMYSIIKEESIVDTIDFSFYLRKK